MYRLSVAAPATLRPARGGGNTVGWRYAAAELRHVPISNALAAEAAPPQTRGRYLTAYQYCFTIATIVVPWMFTSLFACDRVLPWIVIGATGARF